MVKRTLAQGHAQAYLEKPAWLDYGTAASSAKEKERKRSII